MNRSIISTKRPVMGFFDTPEHPKRYQFGLLIGAFISWGTVKKVELDHNNCSKTVFRCQIERKIGVRPQELLKNWFLGAKLTKKLHNLNLKSSQNHQIMTCLIKMPHGYPWLWGIK